MHGDNIGQANFYYNTHLRVCVCVCLRASYAHARARVRVALSQLWNMLQC